MLHSIKIREDSETLDKLISLQNQRKYIRFQDELVKQFFREDMKRVVEPLTDMIEDVSEDVTKTNTETPN